MLACLKCCIGSRKVKVDLDVEDRSADLVVDSEHSPTAFIPDKPSSRSTRNPSSALPPPEVEPLKRTLSRESRTQRLSLVLQNAGPQLVAGIRRSFVGRTDFETLTSPPASYSRDARPRTNSVMSSRNTRNLSIAISEAELPTQGTRYSDDPFAPPTPGFTTRNLSLSINSAMNLAGPGTPRHKYKVHSRSTSCLALPQFPPSAKYLPDEREAPLMSASSNKISPRDRLPSIPRLSSMQLSNDWDTAELYLNYAARNSTAAAEGSSFALERGSESEVMKEEVDVMNGTSTVETKSTRSLDSGGSRNQIAFITRNNTSISRVPRGLSTGKSPNETEAGKNTKLHHPNSRRPSHSLGSVYFTAIDHD